VIGGGFSGALTAAHLARRGVPVTLVGRDRRLGPGLAYGSDSQAFVLNVPAARMSAWPDQPDHFLQWLRREQPDAEPGSFARRDQFGRYVEHVVEATRGRLASVHAEAVDVQRAGDGFTVSLADGRRLDAQSVVLALGNAPPRPLIPTEERLEGVVENPFAMAHGEGPREHDTVALAGTGLTALDVMAWLHELGHRGPIVAFSRHGLAPIAHRGRAPVALPALPSTMRRRPSIRRLTAWLRQLATTLQAFDLDPARAVDALRPMTAELWQRLPATEQRRFLRHARVWWDVHRHRAPASVFEMLAEGRRAGRIAVHAARLQRVAASAAGLQLTLRPRGSATTVDLSVQWLVNCTGPERALARLASPLVKALLARGLVEPDPLGLGAITTERGELVDASGAIVHGAYVVGGWRMPRLFESTAVPELREQAAEVALDVVARLAVRSAEMPATA
jgi:uncharacterized NAD(P)/FAD-binding protein YdhS